MKIMSESETVCCDMFNSKPLTQSDLEALFDQYENDILFMNKDSEKLNDIPIVFSSNYHTLGNKYFLVYKVSYEGNMSIVLIYKKNGDKRKFIVGHVIHNDKKYDIVDFNIYTDMYINEKLYDSIGMCFYNS
jgi:hypothetical protein